MPPKILKIGHRGASGYEPENTLLSFQKGIDLGVDMIELDVYCCKSGELVVIHDDKVDRTTNGKGYVWDKTLEELQSFDAGKGEKIPTLNAVLDLIDKKVSVNIELKGEGTAKPVSDLINYYVSEKGWTKEMFLVSSFNHPELVKFKKFNLEIKIGALSASIPIDYARFAQDLGAYSVNLCIDFINQNFVDDAHKRGLKVFVWTVNNLDDMNRMKTLGIDGVFSNFPNRI